MRRRNPRPGQPRSGKVLVMLALLLPGLLGMAGLAIDGGLLMAAHRQAQNAADAAAMAAAMDKMQGKSNATATATATTFVKDPQYNNLPNATLALHIPPTSGPYAGTASYVEAIVTSPVRTSFIQALGVNASQQVQVRAVAAIEPVAAGAGVMALDPNAQPGLSASGNGALSVDGGVVVNAQANVAVTVNGNGTIKARDVQVVGGVNNPAKIRPFAAGDPDPLHTGTLPKPDPMRNLPTPTASTPGVDTTYRGAYKSTNGSQTLYPGVYDSIKISGNPNVTFSPGIYIIAATGSSAISISGGPTVRGNGVMFYNTGSNFAIGTGLPDASDGDGPVGPTQGAKFGDISISGGGDVELKGLIAPQSPFNGMLFYQRRWNTSEISLTGNGSDNKLEGTLYAKWANFKLAGQGQYDAQFIVGTLTLSGNGDITVKYAGKNLGKADQVFLVE